nr:lens fiber membrane intrinsic protein isoform X2 [Hydra vulgaris]
MALLSIINCGLICVGVAFAIFSITGNYWLSASFSHRGLWFNCSKACEKVHHKKDNLIVTETFMIIGCLTYFLAFVLSVLNCSKKINIIFPGVVLCATAVFLAIGLSVYTMETNQNKALKLSWSYIIGWCSCIISTISAVICFVMKRNKQSTYSIF